MAALQMSSENPPMESRPRQWARKAVRSFGVFYNRIEAELYDLRHRTDTGGKIAAARLDIPQDITTHITGFQSVNESHLRRVLDAVTFPEGSTFVDIGCGKGKALLIAATYPFVSRVVGVELAESLCKVSEANIEVARRRHGFSKAADIIHGDAVQIEFTKGENIFFLNNPFDASFMIKMIDRLQESAARDGRKIWVLYGNPAHTDAILKDGRLKPVREFKFFGPGRNIFVFQL
jgi:SAM-dependent methyltransferase